MICKSTILLLTILISVSSANAKKFSEFNYPSAFAKIAGTSLLTQFSDLPISGKLSDDRYGWSETYWPSNIGGIGYRWNHPDPQPLSYPILTRDQVLSMDQFQLSQLSPSELYDISQGDYQFTLTKATRVLYSKNDAWWEGICHGWSQAAANFPEPSPVVVTNKDGVRVPFGSSDVKGLMAMHDATSIEENKAYAQIGQKCEVRGKVPEDRGDTRDGNLPIPTEEDYRQTKCDDINAGTFHVVIANMIGIHSKSFVAEVDRMADLWNQPVLGYDVTILGEEVVTPEEIQQGIHRKIRVANKMAYGEELQIWTAQKQTDNPKWIHWLNKAAVTGTDIQQVRYKNYQYILELNQQGAIIGGEWVQNDGTRPDFIWGKKRLSKFMDINYEYKKGSYIRLPLKGLNSIFRPVLR